MTDPIYQLPNGDDISYDHIIAEMYREHEQIVSLLDRLDETIAALQGSDNEDGGEAVLADLHAIAEDLCGAEPHHEREERVLFLELKKRGIHGPPHCMEEEHETLRAMKTAVRDLSAEAGGGKRGELKSTATQLSTTLRSHIQKENEILYPMSLQAIDDATWVEMRKKADEIGPCQFRTLTPAGP